jgi:hypothetical protein
MHYAGHLAQQAAWPCFLDHVRGQVACWQMRLGCFPSSRCASATKNVRPFKSNADTQPQLQPALLRLSAIISRLLPRDTNSPLLFFAKFLESRIAAQRIATGENRRWISASGLQRPSRPTRRSLPGSSARERYFAYATALRTASGPAYQIGPYRNRSLIKSTPSPLLRGRTS